MSGNKKTMPPG